MATVTVTASNWNDPSFWSSLALSGDDNALDLTALDASFVVDLDVGKGTLTITRNGESFRIVDGTASSPDRGPRAPDATLGRDATFAQVSVVRTGDAAMAVAGDGSAETLRGGAGDDTVAGGSGNDDLDGGTGDDQLAGGSGRDSLRGGAGHDQLSGAAGDDTLDGGGGDDRLSGGGGTDRFHFGDGSGNDLIADFDVNSDLVVVRSRDVGTWADVAARLTENGNGHAVLTLSDGSGLTFWNVPRMSLSERHFDVEAPVCLAAGTRVATPLGDVAVETLTSGDEVLTSDGATARILLVLRREMRFGPLSARHRPILISAGSLGGGRPSVDLVVSPLHRVLVGGEICMRLFDTREALGPAKGLLALPGIRQMKGRRSVTYVSLLLDRHAVMIAEGAPVESLLPGPMTRRMVGPDAYRRIRALIGDDPSAYGPPARRLLTRRQMAAFAAATMQGRREGDRRRRARKGKTPTPGIARAPGHRHA